MLKPVPPHLRKLVLIATIMVMAFIAFALIIEVSKETSKEMTQAETATDPD